MGKKKYTDKDASRGRRIKSIRLKNKITQEQLAEKLDITVSALKKLEKGINNITAKELSILKKEYSVSADYILFGDVWTDEDREYSFVSMDGDEKIRLLIRLLMYLCEVEKKDVKALIQEETQ